MKWHLPQKPIPMHLQKLSSIPMVLHVRVVNGAGGGPDKTILRSSRFIDSAQYRMAAAYIHNARDKAFDTLRNHAKQEDAVLLEVPELGPLDPRTPAQLLKICRKLNVSIWHGHDYKSNAMGLLLNRFHPMKLVTTVHGWTWDTARTKLYYHLDNLCIKQYEQVIAVSSKLYDHCLALGVNKRCLTYIPNGIDLNEYQSEQTPIQAKEHLKINPSQFIIGVVGRLSVEKGVDRAIELIQRLAPQFPQVQLHLIGDGPTKLFLKTLAKQHGVTKRVHFWGWQKHTLPFFKAMDMLLLPSHTEGLPNAVLEAMAVGVPIAATNVGGVNELLDGGVCGIMLDPKKTESWHTQISQLINNAPQRHQFTERAWLRVQQHFTFTKRMERVVAIYDQVIRKNQAVAAA